MDRLSRIAKDARALCLVRGWSRTLWETGCCLHLEASEFIEALRGKRGDPIKEAADVLFVLLSACEVAGLSIPAIIERLEELSMGAAVNSNGDAPP